jgi:hypothetical protein
LFLTNDIELPIIDGKEDYDCVVEFVLRHSVDQDVTSISRNDSPYSHLKVPLGLVRSILLYNLTDHSTNSYLTKFDMIIESGCTHHMMPFQTKFISYNHALNLCVILADKSAK